MGFFFSPTGYLRSFTLFLGEFFKEMIQARRTRRSGIRPQMHRGLKYAGMRAASNVLLRDVNTAIIIDEMYRGTNVIYADFTDYDELAHHCGPERVESLQALDGVDQAIASLIKATEEAPRPYKFVVLSDHGQSLGETFLQRYGVSLGEYVRSLMSGRATLVETKTQAEGSTFVNSFLSEITQAKGVGPTVARAALAGKTTDGVVNLDDGGRDPRRRSVDDRRRRLRQPGPCLVHRSRPSADCRGAGGAPSRPRRGSGRPPRGRDAPCPLQGGRSGRVRSQRHALSRPGPGRRRGPDDPVRPAYDHEPQARGRHDPRARPAAPQRVQPGARRGRRVRGADRLARRARRPADGAVHPPSGRVDARRGCPARRAGYLPQPPPLARLDRDPVGQAAGTGRGGAPTPESAVPEPATVG